jgi:hypothetical protein
LSPVTIIKGGLAVPVFVIQNLTEWQNFYGCTNPPPAPTVNFNSQMILLLQYQACFDLPSFSNVCLSSSQVMVSIKDVIQEPQCLVITTPWPYIAITAPNSNLPITWQVSISTE